MDAAVNVILCQFGKQSFPVGHDQLIDVEGALLGMGGRNNLNLGIFGKALVVHLHDLPAADIFLIQIGQLSQSNGSHDGVAVVLVANIVHAVVPLVGALAAGAGVGVLVNAHPGDLAALGVQLPVGKADHAAVAGGQVLDGLIGVDGHVHALPGAGGHAVYPGAGHMGGIQNQAQAVVFADFQNLVQLANPAAVAYEHHGTGLVGDLLLHVSGVKAEVLIHVGEDGLQVFIENGVVGGDEGDGGGDDLIPVLPAIAALENIGGQMQAGGVGV